MCGSGKVSIDGTFVKVRIRVGSVGDGGCLSCFSTRREGVVHGGCGYDLVSVGGVGVLEGCFVGGRIRGRSVLIVVVAVVVVATTGIGRRIGVGVLNRRNRRNT